MQHAARSSDRARTYEPAALAVLTGWGRSRKSQEEDTPSHPRFAMARVSLRPRIVIFVLIDGGRACFLLFVQERGIPASGFVGGRLADVQCVRVAIPQLEDPRAVHDLVELFGIEFGEQAGRFIGRQVV